MAGFTKKAIRDSFVKLLNEKPLSKITVRDIVTDCGINRNTFYYYFQDLPQLIEAIVSEDVTRIIQEYPSLDSIEECLRAVISFALENRKAVMHIYHSVNRDIYEQYQWRVCEYTITTYVDSILSVRAVTEQDRRLIIDYLKCVCFGLIMGWLENGMQEDVPSLFHRICELKQGELEQMIDRCEASANGKPQK